MKIEPFRLEDFFSRYEFSVKYMLSASDCGGIRQSELLDRADPECKGLWDELELGYTKTSGHPALLQEISKLYEGISPEEIVVAAPEELIFIAMNCILAPGNHVVCTSPGYQSLYEIANSIGCKVDKWLPDESRGWKFDVDELEGLLKPHTKLIVVNFPHNPTGYLPSGSEYARIMEIAKSRNIALFSDEMYRFLEFDQNDRLPSGCELYDDAISLFGMSKTFGLAGLRIGWIVTKNPEFRKQILDFKSYTTICSSAPSEILSIMGLRSKDDIIERHLKRIGRNLNLLDEFFAQHSDKFEWVRPKAGTICMPKLITGEDSTAFCDRTRKESEVLFAPSRLFDYESLHFRLGFGRENMPKALKAFDDFLR